MRDEWIINVEVSVVLKALDKRIEEYNEYLNCPITDENPSVVLSLLGEKYKIRDEYDKYKSYRDFLKILSPNNHVPCTSDDLKYFGITEKDII